MHWLFVALAIVGACKKDKTQAPPSPAAPASTAEQDALWALAPEGVIGGMIATPDALAKIERGALAVDKVFATAPDLAPFKAKMEAELQEVLGTKTLTFAAAGLTTQKGFAAFLVDKEVILIVPVGDRAKFMTVAKGTQGADGVDQFKKAKCKTVKNVYACAKDAAVLDRVGKGTLTETLKLVGARGDIEIAGTSPTTPPVTGAAVVQLGAGSLTVRAAVKGLPAEVKPFFANAKPRTDGDKTAGFALVAFDKALAMFADKVPPQPLGEGVTADVLVKSLVGPLTMTVDNGAMTFDVRLPLNDSAPAQKLVEQCDKFPPLAQLGATVKDGVCHVAIPQMQLALDAWLDGKTLRIGQKGGTPTNQASPLSPIAKELADGEWTFAMFGRGTMYAPVTMSIPAPPDALPPEAMLGIRALAMLNEVGFGVRLDGEVVRGVATVRTLWSNPDDVVAKLVAIDPKAILAGKAAEQGKAIAEASPKSPFAADVKAGMTGLMTPVAMIGIVAAVAIPAFVDYTKKPAPGEAPLQLNKLKKALEQIYVEDSGFPPGKVGPTPAKPCCGSTPDNKCAPDRAAWEDPMWKRLDFLMYEPHTYRYSYESTEPTSFVVKAVGDLDCDGNEATWTLTGSTDAGLPVITIQPPPAGTF